MTVAHERLIKQDSAILRELEKGRTTLLIPGRWGKGADAISRGKSCLLQACGFGASLVIRAAIERLFPDRLRECGSCVRFNDHPLTTHEDVLAVVNAAIANEKLKGDQDAKG